MLAIRTRLLVKTFVIAVNKTVFGLFFKQFSDKH